MKSALDSLIEELEASSGARNEARYNEPKECRPPKRIVPAHFSKDRRQPREEWPSESLDAEHRFGQPHAKLFPFIGRKVRTPQGPGMLIQVFAERVTVLLDSHLDKCAVFSPGEIEPVALALP